MRWCRLRCYPGTDGFPHKPTSRLKSRVDERIGDLATAEAWPTAVTGLLGTQRGHWIDRRGAMRRNVASKERQEAKYDGHCH